MVSNPARPAQLALAPATTYPRRRFVASSQFHLHGNELRVAWPDGVLRAGLSVPATLLRPAAVTADATPKDAVSTTSSSWRFMVSSSVILTVAYDNHTSGFAARP